jgi:cytochrome b pre-mRNA-processing protein 3
MCANFGFAALALNGPNRHVYGEFRMLIPRLRRKRREDTISAVYGAIVAQARHKALYLGCGVPDSVDGRLAMIVLHLALVLRRLASASEEARAFGQALFDAFCRDMDHNLREMGVGDLAVPRRMRRIGEEFYGQSAAYGAALAAGDRNALQGALARNVLGAENPAAAAGLALYVEAMQAHLSALDPGTIVLGGVSFPDPARPAHPAKKGDES